MAYQIIQQPNKKYAIFSSISEQFTDWNLTVDEIVDCLIEKHKIKEAVQKIVDDLTSGKKPYAQFTLTWEEALQEHLENGGCKIPDDTV